ncbi:MAG: hypothetical protein H6741_06270 [Alphaproteobacteria bacterium]|nr:hypothetical protein [Alphaproteobacteria bacterium]
MRGAAQTGSVATLLVLLSCGGKDDSAAPEDTSYCADVPLVNYDNFGQGFITHMCQGCHASTTPNRYDAPAEVTFDTVEEVWAWQERILARSAGDDPTMPPAGGTSEDDRVKLEWWLRCAESGT